MTLVFSRHVFVTAPPPCLLRWAAEEGTEASVEIVACSMDSLILRTVRPHSRALGGQGRNAKVMEGG